MPDLIVTEALGSAIQQYEDDRALPPTDRPASAARGPAGDPLAHLAGTWRLASCKRCDRSATPTALHPPARSTAKTH